MHVCVCPTKSERRDGKFFAMRKNQGMDAEKCHRPMENLSKYPILEIINETLKMAKKKSSMQTKVVCTYGMSSRNKGMA